MKINIIFLLLAGLLLHGNSLGGKKNITERPVYWVDSLIKFDLKFKKNDSVLAPQGKKWLTHLKGSKKILLTAPHATAQTRDGEIKESETGTGALALVLHKLLDVPVLYVNYMSPSDPNYYDKNEFKDSLLTIIERDDIQFVLDLHGAHPDRPFNVDLGTMYGKSYMDKKYYYDSLKAAFKSNGIKKISRDFFPAIKNRTITRFTVKNGVPAIQLEINYDYLMPDNSNQNYKKTQKLIKALTRFLSNNGN